MIEVSGLRKEYRGREVLRGVEHTFADGRLSYLLGLNGAGKSTRLRCIAGVTRPDGGGVRIDGRAPASLDAPVRHLGMHLSADAFTPGHTARRHLRWLAALGGVPAGRADALLDEVGLAAVADRPVGGFSLGMRQRLGIASALVGNPRTLLLDEPLNGLDVAGVLWMRGLLQQWAAEGRCVVVASHALAEVERTADEVVMIEDGRIVAAGGVAEVQGTCVDLEEAFAAHVPRVAAGHAVAG